MGSFNIKLSQLKMNNAGAREILNSPSVQSDLLNRVSRIKAKAEATDGSTYDADVRSGKNRAHAMVKTTDMKSIISNRKRNTLLKSLDAGG